MHILWDLQVTGLVELCRVSGGKAKHEARELDRKQMKKKKTKNSYILP